MSKKVKEPKQAKAMTGGKTKADLAPKAGDSLDRDGMLDKQVLQISKAIADPRRMAMLRAIAQKTANCSGLMQCTGVSAATLSHHMKELETAGLIETTKEGRLLQATLQRKVWKSYLATLKALAG